jgi:hypothetical protein
MVMNKPETTARGVCWHRSLLALACAACILALALEELPDGRVAVRGRKEAALPQVCAARVLLGWNCPGCGLTRSVIHLAAGDWRASWRRHRLGGLFALAIVLQVPYRLVALRRPDHALISARWQAALALALFALLIANWLPELVRRSVLWL